MLKTLQEQTLSFLEIQAQTYLEGYKVEETKLAIYITQARYTHQAISGLVQNPEDRYEEVRGLFERAGCKLLSYYMTFGEYDFIIIYEAPNPVAVMSVLATAGAGGGVTDTKTITAVTTAEAREAFELAKAAAGKFRSAGT